MALNPLFVDYLQDGYRIISMLEQLEKRLDSYRPWSLNDTGVSAREASVLCLLTEEESPHVILTVRASRLPTHAGEVAFPGGKRDPDDSDLLSTALRETQEEIGVNPEQIRIIGSLSQVLSLHKVAVTPWVGIVDPSVSVRPNPGEIETIFRTPLAYLCELDNARLDKFRSVDGHTRYVPSWQYQGQEIWGLTAWVLAELLNVGLDAGIPTRPRPERQL